MTVAAPESLDFDWAVRSGGALSARQRAQLLAPIVRLSGHLMSSRITTAFGRRGAGSLDLTTLKLPDSQLVRDAESEADEVLSPSMVQHCYRTFVFSLGLATLDGIDVPDLEAAYVACLLHDLYIERPETNHCFAVAGGEHAQDFALKHGVEPDRARTIGAAIAGHLTVGAAEDLGDPAGFVSAGAFLDVVGRRLNHLTPQFVDAVNAQYPRLGFKKAISACVRPEADAVPKGRVHMLRYPFPILIKIAPFDE